MTYKQIKVIGNLVEAPLKPCPWCKKTPNLRMPLDQNQSVYMNGSLHDDGSTWVWNINCDCGVYSEVKVSIRNTSKTILSRFLDKVDELFDKWNAENPIKAYEKKVLDLRNVPNLGVR